MLALSSLVSPVFPSVKAPELKLGAIPATPMEGNERTVFLGAVASSTPDGRPVLKDGKPLIVHSLAFYQAWDQYFKNGWEKIDTTISKVGGRFTMDQAPFEFTGPPVANGPVLFHNNNQWDDKKQDQITTSPLELTITALGVDPVQGELRKGNLGLGVLDVDYIVYPDAYPSVAFTNGFFRPSFKLEYSEKVSFSREVNGEKTKWLEGGILGTKKPVAVKVDSTTQSRGASMKQVRIWDLKEDGRKEQAVQLDVSKVGVNSYTATKLIPENFFATSSPVSADLIYYIGRDPAPNLQKLVCFKDAAGGYIACTDLATTFSSENADEGSIADGRVAQANNNSWATSRNVDDGTSADTGGTDTNCPNVNEAAGNFEFIRCWFGFKTGPIITTTTDILDMKLSIYTVSPGNGDNDGVDYWILTEGNAASDAAIAVADIDAITDTSGNNPFVNGTEYKDMSDVASSSGSWIDGTNIPNGARVEWQVNSTGTPLVAKGATGGIGADGNTYFVLVEGHDYTNEQIGTAQNNFGTSYAGSANPPILFAEIASGTPAAAAPAKKGIHFRSRRF